MKRKRKNKTQRGSARSRPTEKQPDSRSVELEHEPAGDRRVVEPAPATVAGGIAEGVVMEPAPHPALPGGLRIDGDFLRRVYRTSIVVMLLLGIFIGDRTGLPGTIGWFVGALLGLLVLLVLEWSVRYFLQPGRRSLVPVVLISGLKLTLAAGVLVLAFLGAMQGWVSLFWLFVGFSLPHLVIVLKVLGQILVAYNAEHPPQRFPARRREAAAVEPERAD